MASLRSCAAADMAGCLNSVARLARSAEVQGPRLIDPAQVFRKPGPSRGNQPMPDFVAGSLLSMGAEESPDLKWRGECSLLALRDNFQQLAEIIDSLDGRQDHHGLDLMASWRFTLPT